MATKVSITPELEGVDPKLYSLARDRNANVLIRLQPEVYNYDSGAYHAWKKRSWIVEVVDEAEAKQFLEALEQFFTVWGKARAGCIPDLTEYANTV